ncbi:coagulation factor XIII B chain-like [Epinephelus lanceolatus]
MCVRYLGFVLLVWFPGVLHAQSAAQPCRAPRLNGGYLVPEKEAYFHGTTLSYGCDDGLKPAVEGWWATSTCHNGSWSHEPQCIDEKACLPPDIPNAKYTASQNGWYKDENKLRITCDNGYEPKDRQITTKCINGTWSSVLVCEKSSDSCGEPPKIPHAVIIHQRHQEVYPVDTKLQYECEDGYTVEGADTTKLIFCFSGNWTEGPTCSRETRPVAGQGGSAEVGTAGGHSTSAGSGTQPVGGGSSTTSGSTDRDSGPTFRPVDDCGAYPYIPNSDVVQKDRMFLKYQCKAFHTLVGEATVACYSDRTWSPLPVCKETFCVLDPAQDPLPNVKLSRVEYLKEGERKHFPCVWRDYSRLVQCTNRRITTTGCCHTYDHQRGVCW